MVFTEEETGLLMKVLSQVTGNANSVTRVFVIRQKLWVGKGQEVDLGKEDLSALAGIVTGFSRFSVDDVPFIMSVTGKLTEAVKALTVKQEEPSESQEETQQP